MASIKVYKGRPTYTVAAATKFDVVLLSFRHCLTHADVRRIFPFKSRSPSVMTNATNITIMKVNVSCYAVTALSGFEWCE